MVVKQNFEIENSKQFYQQEVSYLHNEITEIKKDFSTNLAEVKSSIMLGGMEEEEMGIGNSSMPDVDLYENQEQRFYPNGEGEDYDHQSNASRGSFKGY